MWPSRQLLFEDSGEKSFRAYNIRENGSVPIFGPFIFNLILPHFGCSSSSLLYFPGEEPTFPFAFLQKTIFLLPLNPLREREIAMLT